MENEIKPKITPFFDILKISLNGWWKNINKFILVYFWGLLYTIVPVAIIMILIGFWTAIPSLLYRIPAIFIGVWAVIFILYFSIRIYIATFLLVKNNFEGKELDIYKDSTNYFWSYFSLALLMMILIFLWLFALVIPAIIFSIFYTFSVYAFFFEGKRDIDAITRSYYLVKGYWWAVFGRYFGLGLILWLFMFVLSLPLSLMPEKSILADAWRSLVQIISFLIGPISLLFSYQIYQDLVKIKK